LFSPLPAWEVLAGDVKVLHAIVHNFIFINIIIECTYEPKMNAAE